MHDATTETAAAAAASDVSRDGGIALLIDKAAGC